MLGWLIIMSQVREKPLVYVVGEGPRGLKRIELYKARQPTFTNN